MDYAGEATVTRRVPRDEFETQLMKGLIEAELQKWREVEANIDTSLLADADEDGIWTFYVFEPGPEEDWNVGSFLDRRSIKGSIWVAERYSGKPVVVWSLGDQSNADMPPALFWDFDNPAGPWH